MKRASFLCTLLATGLAALACGSAPQVDTEAEKAAIAESNRKWLAAVEAKDIEACVSFYAPDAVEMQPGMPALVGREAIREWFEAWLPDTSVSNAFFPERTEVAASGDVAYDRGTYRFTGSTPDGPIEDVGKYLVIWKKIDGDWKVVASTSNSDLPQPE